MARTGKWVRLTARITFVRERMPGDQLLIGDEVPREMAADWVARGLAEYTDEAPVIPIIEEKPRKKVAAPIALQAATIEEVLDRAVELLTGQAREAVEMIRRDLDAEYVSMAEFARRMGLDVKEIERAVKDGLLERHDVDSGKKLLNWVEASDAWNAVQAAQTSETEGGEKPAQDDGESSGGPDGLLPGIDPSLQP